MTGLRFPGCARCWVFAAAVSCGRASIFYFGCRGRCAPSSSVWGSKMATKKAQAALLLPSCQKTRIQVVPPRCAQWYHGPHQYGGPQRPYTPVLSTPRKCYGSSAQRPSSPPRLRSCCLQEKAKINQEKFEFTYPKLRPTKWNAQGVEVCSECLGLVNIVLKKIS